ncbi:hypothetical protein IB229_04115 [Pseudomonas sp. PDM14]|uniref:NTF2 fold immunity protein n=1 Tax=Pseudomonas sp. PDM14 TaxID=2769288 RepID=UPI0017810EE3|nr:NTF2 fold immunity protein [Pseudomonas sp. PDM14]MBD9482142.1 hypothetical protein [Pseudomonas sp. PDM14]
MSKSALLIILAMIGTANADSTCPETEPHQTMLVTSASQAIKIAKISMLEISQADYLAGFEPFMAEQSNNIWHVYGSLPPDTLGGTPESKVCATTGEVLDTYHSQ